MMMLSERIMEARGASHCNKASPKISKGMC